MIVTFGIQTKLLLKRICMVEEQALSADQLNDKRAMPPPSTMSFHHDWNLML